MSYRRTCSQCDATLPWPSLEAIYYDKDQVCEECGAELEHDVIDLARIVFELHKELNALKKARNPFEGLGI